MITEDQSKVIALLSSPETHGGGTVERMETHASIVFLAGDRAWKLKRAVRRTPGWTELRYLRSIESLQAAGGQQRNSRWYEINPTVTTTTARRV